MLGKSWPGSNEGVTHILHNCILIIRFTFVIHLGRTLLRDVSPFQWHNQCILTLPIGRSLSIGDWLTCRFSCTTVSFSTKYFKFCVCGWKTILTSNARNIKKDILTHIQAFYRLHVHLYHPINRHIRCPIVHCTEFQYDLCLQNCLLLVARVL